MALNLVHCWKVNLHPCLKSPQNLIALFFHPSSKKLDTFSLHHNVTTNVFECRNGLSVVISLDARQKFLFVSSDLLSPVMVCPPFKLDCSLQNMTFTTFFSLPLSNEGQITDNLAWAVALWYSLQLPWVSWLILWKMISFPSLSVQVDGHILKGFAVVPHCVKYWITGWTALCQRLKAWDIVL